MGEPVSNASQEMILGELRGQVRELIHSVNNLTMNVSSLTREVVALGTLASDMADVKSRLAVLEIIHHKNEGAKGVVGMLVKSPITAWVVSGAIAFYVLFEAGLK